MGIKSFALAILFCVFATTCPFGKNKGMEFAERNGRLDVILNGRALVSGLRAMIRTPKEEFSLENGNLKAIDFITFESIDDDVGEGKMANVEYKNTDGTRTVSLWVHAYPARQALFGKLIYKGPGGMDIYGGLRVEFDGLAGFRRGSGSERHSQFWTRPFFVEDLRDIKNHTQFFMWDAGEPGWWAAIPLCGGGMKGEMSVRNSPGFEASSSHGRFAPEEIPLFAIAWDKNPYRAVEKVYRAGMQAMGNPGKLRVDKEYPEMFEYIGWCSWNAFYHNINRDNLIDSARTMHEADFPAKYFLLDDGWQSVRDRRMTAFEADPEKFPGGLREVVKRVKEDYGFRWVGVWHTFQGYWFGIYPKSELAEKYKDVLFKSFGGILIPDPRKQRGYRFFDDFHEYLRGEGIDFVKVDNQSTMDTLTIQKIPIGYASRNQQYSLQNSVSKHFDNRIINCMDMTIENVYNWRSSNVSRNSDDFFPDREGSHRSHIHQNVYNSLWFSQLSYPDFDMFQSHHPHALFHAVLRAVSGGPIYVTDTPGKSDWELLRRFIYSDGRILRPDHPALPTRDMLLTDPSARPVPLKSFTKSNGAGIVAAFNVHSEVAGVQGTFSPADAELDGGPFAVYDWFSKTARVMERNEKMPLKLPADAVKLFVALPIENGFAPIGLVEKFISPAAVLNTIRERKKITVRLREGGRFGAYSEKEPKRILSDEKQLKYKYGERMIETDVPPGPEGGPVEVTIEF